MSAKLDRVSAKNFQIFDIPVGLSLELVAVVGRDFLDPERELFNEAFEIAALSKEL